MGARLRGKGLRGKGEDQGYEGRGRTRVTREGGGPGLRGKGEDQGYEGRGRTRVTREGGGPGLRGKGEDQGYEGRGRTSVTREGGGPGLRGQGYDSPMQAALAEGDCNKALELEPHNIKALYRRALARKVRLLHMLHHTCDTTTL